MSTETYTFQEAEPVKRAGRQGAGRKKENNPFHEAVRSVVGVTREDGAPYTVSTPFHLDVANGETLEQRIGRIRRFLTRATKELDAQTVVDLSITDLATGETLSKRRDGHRTSGDFAVRFWDRNAGK